MAVFDNDPFPGTNYGQYLNWEQVVTPDGQTYYVVPGNPGYVYDPVASNAAGRKVFRKNPKQQISKQEEEEKRIKDLQDQEKFNRSPAGQLIPVAAGTAGTIAAAEALKPGPSLADKVIEAELIKQGKIPGPTTSTAGNVAASGSPSSPTVISGSRLPAEGASNFVGPSMPSAGDPNFVGPVNTNTLPPGTEVTPEGTIINSQTGQVVGRVVQGALGAYQIYQGVGEFKDDKIGGGLGVLSGAANVGAALGSETAGSFAGPLMAASGGYHTLNSFQNGGENIRGSMAELGAGIGTIIAPGVGTIGGAAIGNALGYGIDKLGGLGLYHETTRQRAQRHTGELLEQGKDDQNYQNYVGGMREQFNAEPPDPSKPFHGGQYGSWDEYKQAGLDAKDLTGVYGNIKTYGPAWARLTQAQREAVTQANIDSGIYNSNKGEVEISDQNKAKENFDNVMKGFNVGVQTQAVKQTPGAIAAAPPPPIPRPITQGSRLTIQGQPATQPSQGIPFSGNAKIAALAGRPIIRPVVRR